MLSLKLVLFNLKKLLENIGIFHLQAMQLIKLRAELTEAEEKSLRRAMDVN